MTPIPESQKIKQILLAVATDKNIHAQTFKSIYDLEIPEGYKVTFQYFFGYQIAQIRNLAVSWIINAPFDYMFSVDSDIVLPKDTLAKMLKANKDIISGVYRQRRRDKQVIEIFESTPNGGTTQTTMDKLMPQGLHRVVGCGFGCVLVKGDVFKKIGYPQFEYHSALKIEDTISEDTDFSIKAMKKGFEIWCDSSIICGHLGTENYAVEIPSVPHFETATSERDKRFRELANQRLLPEPAQKYLNSLKNSITPKVIFDTGACVMHWTTVAKEVWPDARFVLFEAMDGPQFLYEEAGIKDYHMGVLSDKNGRIVQFYENEYHPGGNSYYRENTPEVDQYFPKSSKKEKISKTLDQVVKERKFPFPDMIKMDVQGAELDILMGAKKCLAHATDLILELQVTEYNVGAPLKDEVIKWLADRGWRLVVGNFSQGTVDGDYHFTKIKLP